jgi:hypothetical protein
LLGDDARRRDCGCRGAQCSASWRA